MKRKNNSVLVKSAEFRRDGQRYLLTLLVWRPFEEQKLKCHTPTPNNDLDRENYDDSRRAPRYTKGTTSETSDTTKEHSSNDTIYEYITRYRH